MAMESNTNLDKNIPQWKKDLILRRRAVGRVLPTGSGSVQLTCPSVVAAVRNAEYSVNSDFLRRRESEREQTGGRKNMRLVEQVTASDDFVEPCVIFDIKEIITKIESGSAKNSKMGEEKNLKKINNAPIICEKKAEDDTDGNASDSSEEFKYGPGIVSKLKSKYLSLTLRESQGRNRPPLDNLRRATSLENILDGSETDKIGEYKSNYLKNIQPSTNGSSQRARGLTRVNRESMKRARSVEVLTRYDRSNSNRKNSEEQEVFDKQKVRNRFSSSSVEETELPPPDLVKHTLKIFESSHNVMITPSIKKKNQKNDSFSAKKVISQKPSVVKQNGFEVTNSANEINKFSDRENLGKSTVEKRKAELLKDTSETVINKKPQSKVTEDKKSTPSQPSKEKLSLDLTDTSSTKPKASPVTLTSPKSDSESLEPKRCISPVLVRAPPCILSSELNSSTSPPQHVKQVGVIRPIITNKTIHSKTPKNQFLTEREIEKNLLNTVKSIEQPVTKVIVSLKKSPEECFVGNDVSKENENVKRGQYWDKKPNTMVFNFSNRKTVPDYIENDGLILAPRKEKPKLEPGIILLSGGVEDSSTDFDSDELSPDPPSPCDVVFEGDNVLINGKSNIQSKPKQKKMKIQFNDEATTLFEYPSEASLLDDQENANSESEVPSSVDTTTSPGLPNPFRCSSLASYTPSKVDLAADFQLGVTKTTPPPAPTPAPRKTEREEEDEEEEELEGCLRPADESSTVSWSAETAADLLF